MRATPTSVVVRWRTATPSDGRVRFGPAPDHLDGTAALPEATTEHVVELANLAPSTRYHYSVGSSAAELAPAAADQFFVTPPVAGTSQPVRIWAIGDSGTG